MVGFDFDCDGLLTASFQYNSPIKFYSVKEKSSKSRPLCILHTHSDTLNIHTSYSNTMYYLHPPLPFPSHRLPSPLPPCCSSFSSLRFFICSTHSTPTGRSEGIQKLISLYRRRRKRRMLAPSTPSSLFFLSLPSPLSLSSPPLFSHHLRPSVFVQRKYLLPLLPSVNTIILLRRRRKRQIGNPFVQNIDHLSKSISLFSRFSSPPLHLPPPHYSTQPTNKTAACDENTTY